MSDSRPVLLIILAETCSGCLKFKSTLLPQLESEVQRSRQVRLVKVNIPDMKREKIPEYLQRQGIQASMISEIVPYLEWFPNLLLVSGPSWNRGRNLEISSLNGTKTASGWQPSPKIPLTKDTINKWISDYSAKVGQSQVVLTQGGSSVPPTAPFNAPAPTSSVSYVPTVGAIRYKPRNF